MAIISHAPNPDGIYIVFYSLISFRSEGKERNISRLVKAHQFGPVEAWADENCPDGYELTAIEKEYAHRVLFEEQNPDAILTEIRS